MMKQLAFILVIVLICGCGGAKSATVATNDTRLDDLIAKRFFTLEAQWARPQPTAAMASLASSGILGMGNTAGSINLIGNPNYFKIMGDSVSVFLPYFGERWAGGGYGDQEAIAFEGVPTDFKIDALDKDKGYRITLSMKADSEHYRVAMRLFPNLNGSVRVTSSHRFPIHYQGKLGVLPE